MKKIQINNSVAASREEAEFKREILKMEEQIASIEKNIADYESQRARELEDLSMEKNYDLFFYIAGGLVLLNLIFKFNIPGLLIAFLFGGMFFAYKKYFTKEIRASRINSEVDVHITELHLEVTKWQEKIEALT